jgi:hypothetical protein
MFKTRTHFEQVPLETVRKIIEEQIRRETTTNEDQGTQKKTLEEGQLGAQEDSTASSLTFSQVE